MICRQHESDSSGEGETAPEPSACSCGSSDGLAHQGTNANAGQDGGLVHVSPAEIRSLDAALMRRIASKSDGAVEELIERFSTLVRSIAASKAGAGYDVQAVIQETFWQLWKSAAAFDPAKATLQTWVMLITRRVAVKHLLKARRHPSSQFPDQFAMPQETAEFDLQVAEQNRLVQKAVAVLRSENGAAAEVFLLRSLYGLSFSQIGKLLNLKEPTCRTRFYSARERLQRSLASVRPLVNAFNASKNEDSKPEVVNG